MTIMQAVLFPPLDEDEEDYKENDTQQHPLTSITSHSSCDGHGDGDNSIDHTKTGTGGGNFMSPELRARFENLKRLRDDGNNPTTEEDSPSTRRRVELATETAILAQSEIARMRQAIAELEGLLDAHSNNESSNLEQGQEDFNEGQDEEIIDDDEEDEYHHPGKPAAMISFPTLPQLVVFDDHAQHDAATTTTTTHSTKNSSQAAVHVTMGEGGLERSLYH